MIVAPSLHRKPVYYSYKNIEISLTKDNSVKLHYKDDGNGFDVIKIKKERKGMGLFNLSNRIKYLNESINIDSEINKGTKINISIPCVNK